MARHQRSSKQTVAITVYQHQHGRYGSWWTATGVWCPCGRRSGSAKTVVTGGKPTDWCGGGICGFFTTWWQKLQCNFRQWSLHDGEAKRRPTLATTCVEVKLERLKHTEIKTSAANRYRRLMSRRQSHQLPSASPPQSVMMLLLPRCRRCSAVDFKPGELLGFLSFAKGCGVNCKCEMLIRGLAGRLTLWLGHRWCYLRPAPSVLHSRWSSFGKETAFHAL